MCGVRNGWSSQTHTPPHTRMSARIKSLNSSEYYSVIQNLHKIARAAKYVLGINIDTNQPIPPIDRTRRVSIVANSIGVDSVRAHEVATQSGVRKIAALTPTGNDIIFRFPVPYSVSFGRRALVLILFLIGLSYLYWILEYRYYVDTEDLVSVVWETSAKYFRQAGRPSGTARSGPRRST